jgi:hypothetical protein
MSRMVLLLLTSVLGCAGSSAERPDRAAHAPPVAPREGHAAPVSREADVAGAPAATAAPAIASAAKSAPEQARSESSLPDRVEAGSIEHSALLAMQSSGVGRFLQKVRAEPHLEAGHFVGWRLLGFRGEGQGGALRPGDTVLRVNGQGIERPEQFKDVWDSLATQDELVLLVQRAGKRSELHYRIVK